MNRAGDYSFFLDVVAGKANGEDRPDKRNRLEEFLNNRPTHPAFDCLRHTRDQTTSRPLCQTHLR